MAKILFASKKYAKPAIVAAATAQKFAAAMSGLVIHAASDQDVNDEKRFMDFLKSHGLTTHVRIMPLQGINLYEYDLIVCLCPDGDDILKRFPGSPAFISWPICGPEGCTNSELEIILKRTSDLIEQGYLHALIASKQQAEMVLESLKEGILAHDLKRRIFVFNRAAEKITGYSRKEVLGRDCHEVFPGKFCGEKCNFCNLSSIDHDALKSEYSVNLTSKKGERRIINMNLFPVNDHHGTPYGVVASFRDITEELNMKRRLLMSGSFHGMIGKDPKMQDLFATIEDVAKSNLPVLILGESGTGKELVASLIHKLSPRADHLFVPVNCGAIPENLLESELFGHEKGAFTGAIRAKKGRFEIAHKGTLFLDEIGDLPLSMQVKLLRVLQDGSFQRVGGEYPIKVDVRIVAATNKDLEKAVREGSFREDLYYRICVFPLTVPPLRERKSDIPLLANHFLERALAAFGKREAHCAIGSDAMALLIDYDWPGNVRELENAIQYALLKCKGRLIEPVHLPQQVLIKRGSRDIRVPARSSGLVTQSYKRRGRRPKPLTIDMVKDALRAANDNRKRAAQILGVSRATLYRFLDKHDI